MLIGPADALLTPARSRVSEVSASPGRLGSMTDDGAATRIREAIGGDRRSIDWISIHADTSENAVVVVMAALLEPGRKRLMRADQVATTSRDRQIVAIARAHLSGDAELVDALARDHLVDFPDSLIVSWIASGAVARAR